MNREVGICLSYLSNYNVILTHWISYIVIREKGSCTKKTCRKVCKWIPIPWCEDVCDGACVAWNTIVTEVVTVGDCVANGMKELVKKFECAKYLPKCVDMVGCYVGEVTNDALSCGSGFVSPSVECLEEAGYA